MVSARETENKKGILKRTLLCPTRWMGDYMGVYIQFTHDDCYAFDYDNHLSMRTIDSDEINFYEI